MAVAWRNKIDYLPDPTHNGAMGAGLAGQLFLFGGPKLEFVKADGVLTVDLIDETRARLVNRPRPQSRWQFNTEMLRTAHHRRDVRQELRAVPAVAGVQAGRHEGADLRPVRPGERAHAVRRAQQRHHHHRREGVGRHEEHHDDRRAGRWERDADGEFRTTGTAAATLRRSDPAGRLLAQPRTGRGGVPIGRDPARCARSGNRNCDAERADPTVCAAPGVPISPASAMFAPSSPPGVPVAPVGAMPNVPTQPLSAPNVPVAPAGATFAPPAPSSVPAVPPAPPGTSFAPTAPISAPSAPAAPIGGSSLAPPPSSEPVVPHAPPGTSFAPVAPLFAPVPGAGGGSPLTPTVP